MRRRVAIGFVIVLAVLAWWTVRRLPVRTVDPPAISVPVAMLASAPVLREPAAAPTDDPVAARAVKEAALAALAAVTGRYVVVCPPLQDDGDSTTWSFPEGATCATTPGIMCAMLQPAGSIVVWRDEGDQAPVAVYRWDTAADGVTTCVVEPPTQTWVRLRVLDKQGTPRAGAWVATSDLRRGAITDADGWATLPLAHNGTNWVIALYGADGAFGSPVGVAAGGEATIVLGDPHADIAPGAVMLEVRMARLVEAVEDLETTLESSTTPEVAGELSDLLDTQLRILNGVCGTSDVPTCRAWRARH